MYTFYRERAKYKEEDMEKEEWEEKRDREGNTAHDRLLYVYVLCTHTRARPTSANLVFARLILRV